MPDSSVLIILSGKEKGFTFYLVDREHTCGRSSNNSIQIKDQTVSSNHCKFVKNETDSYSIQDLKSTNKIKVNGVEVTNSELKNGDIINLGTVELLFSKETPSEDFFSKNTNGSSDSPDSPPLDFTQNLSKRQVYPNIKNDNFGAKLTQYILVLLSVAIVFLILWLFAISR